MKKAFTTIELVVAVALLAVVMVIAGSIFNITIKAQRNAVAIAEITRNFRAITEQIDRDFKGLVKDGYLVVRCDAANVWKNEADKLTNDNSLKVDARRDNMLFFATGDYQSLLDDPNNSGKYNKSNTAMIYLGLEQFAIKTSDPNYKENCSEWTLARAAALLLPAETGGMNKDYLKGYYMSGLQANTNFVVTCKKLLDPADPNFASRNMWLVESDKTSSNWKYFAGNVGSFKIEWTDVNDPIDANGVIDWQPDSVPANPIAWTPQNTDMWPLAIKFTMTLYDSRAVIPEGKTLTYIVYIKE